ncbi:MAG: NYN domain-containing protein [Ideonella sp.]|nr:NYN domain-containing protein [Ideonella sp.]
MTVTRLTPRVMLLIDADNVTADVIEQAVHLVKERHGAAHVRRAYCTAELALKQLKLFKTHSIRPIVNVSTGKNSTDIALAVDAMDLVVSERPDVVVVVSSDSDFAPLVIRLREKGCRVEGIGQEGKTGDDSKPVYDDFIDLPHRKARGTAVRAAPAKRGRGAARAPVDLDLNLDDQGPGLDVDLDEPAPPPPARKRASRATKTAAAAAATPAAAVPAPAAPAAERSEPPARAARGRTRAPAARHAAAPVPPAPRPAVVLPDEVQRILAALPELQAGSRVQLNLAKERLCSAGLLAKSASSTKLFRKHPGLFALMPESAPNKVEFRRPAGG